MPRNLPKIIEVDGLRYQVDSMDDDLKAQILDLERAELILKDKERTIKSIKNGRKLILVKLRLLLANQKQIYPTKKTKENKFASQIKDFVKNLSK